MLDRRLSSGVSFSTESVVVGGGAGGGGGMALKSSLADEESMKTTLSVLICDLKVHFDKFERDFKACRNESDLRAFVRRFGRPTTTTCAVSEDDSHDQDDMVRPYAECMRATGACNRRELDAILSGLAARCSESQEGGRKGREMMGIRFAAMADERNALGRSFEPIESLWNARRAAQLYRRGAHLLAMGAQGANRAPFFYSAEPLVRCFGAGGAGGGFSSASTGVGVDEPGADDGDGGVAEPRTADTDASAAASHPFSVQDPPPAPSRQTTTTTTAKDSTICAHHQQQHQHDEYGGELLLDSKGTLRFLHWCQNADDDRPTVDDLIAVLPDTAGETSGDGAAARGRKFCKFL